ncbi:MAG: helix-hairpin-helix domain-containing protein [Candidatus Omnitrophica bacterium]|nr:helix-hairpin-helix domain-containing protein [Candidatus Omnitrophota bacterium]
MFYLTSQERKTVIFVLALLILGIGLDFSRKNARPRHLFDYEAVQRKLSKKVDINKAPLSEISSIDGISEQLAKDIIEYRNLEGGFKDINELKNIKGIKDKKLESLKKYITIDP